MSRNEPAAKAGGSPNLSEAREAATAKAEPDISAAEARDESEAIEESGDETAAGADDLGRQLEAARRDAEERQDALLRVQAEMENLRKRSRREVENAHKFGIERLITELLPIKDSMELGLAAAAAEGANVASLRDGSELTLKMLEVVLEKFNVEEIDPADAAFDPEFHQAMSMRDVEGTGAGTVIEVVQKGYSLNGRLVRPAMVIVAK